MGTKATARPQPVQWQKAAPPENLPGGGGQGILYWESGEKWFVFFSGGNKPRQSIAAWPRSPETDTRHIQGMDGLNACPCPASMAAPEAAGYRCLYKAGGKDGECLCRSIGG